MFQTKVVGKIKTQIVRSITTFESHAVYETIRKNIVDAVRPQMTT
jgi:hypothetical protein